MSSMSRSGSRYNHKVAVVTVVAAVATACGAYLLLDQTKKKKQNDQEEHKDISVSNPTTAEVTTKTVAKATSCCSDNRTASGDGIPSEVNIGCCQDDEAKNESSCGCQSNGADEDKYKRVLSPNVITIAYASTTGTCLNLATKMYKELKQQLASEGNHENIVVQMAPTNELDWWDELLNEDDVEICQNNTDGKPPVVMFVLPTWTGGTLPSQHQALMSALEEIQSDWRVAKRPLESTKLQVAVFGMGSSAYDRETFCKPAKSVFAHFLKLGSKPLLASSNKSRRNKTTKSLTLGDDELGDASATFQTWMNHILSHFSTSSDGKKKLNKKTKNTKNKQKQKQKLKPLKEIQEQKEGFVGDDDDQSFYDLSDEEEDEEEPEVADMEDMGDSMNEDPSKEVSTEPKEMVTPKQAIALKKEGYKLIGTHSAVKLCRWTKHQLRGRGGCYKHTFYGITSYQCMEATPSLACANKCVFCWRHHKNPVGREWRWKTDDPYFIVDQAVKMHISMIKETKGIPGVKMDRWKDAHTVRHCALSLVGEPIMYPRVDEFLGDLHARKISTFLVTNGQHPQAIESLRPITQLYVSVDASTKESLIEIDRPLFGDAWERLHQSLRCLKAKGQRTVARLTVVKGWNSGEIDGYARLIALGHVSIVEIKGVTFCGKSDASNLNMSNSPWHHEVVELAQTLQKALLKLRNVQIDDRLESKTGDEYDFIPEYGIACEHKHSCSVLLARVDQFSYEDTVTGQRRWKTWIDYDKFHELAMRNAKDPTFSFGVEDYTADTPDWALFGASEEGFDPTDNRHYRAKKYPKYTKFDVMGIPTHHHDGAPLKEEEANIMRELMEVKKEEIRQMSDSCSVSIVTESKDGEKRIEDASLMFRGLTVAK